LAIKVYANQKPIIRAKGVSSFLSEFAKVIIQKKYGLTKKGTNENVERPFLLFVFAVFAVFTVAVFVFFFFEAK
jgi:hypothetical protein